MKLSIQERAAIVAYTCIRRHMLLYMLFLLSATAAAQDFTVVAVPGHATCPGNGTLTLSTQNADPSQPVTYTVYLLPDTTSTVHNSTGTFVPGLTAGTYLVRATQTVAGNPVTDETEVTINSSYIPVDYDVTSENALCGADGSITIAVNTGNAVSYELFAGPVTRPQQASNIFENLPAGTYTVRVFDECGQAEPQTHTLFTNAPVLVLNGPFFPDTALPSCDEITMAYTVEITDINAPIAYPLTVEITVYPPDGSDVLEYDLVLSDGEPTVMGISQVIPYYYGVTYSADIKVTDPCGIVYEILNGPINPELEALLGTENASCGNLFLKLDVFRYGSPYTMTFIESPEGFDPVAFNADYPGPFAESSIEFGDEENPVPPGIYRVLVEDSCGRSAEDEYEIEVPELPEPQVSAGNNDCLNGLGFIYMLIAGYPLETAIITDAPDAYEHELPQDISDDINNDGELEKGDLPPGVYIVEVTDECGNIYEPLAILVPEPIAEDPQSNARVDCEPGFGALRIYSGLTSAIITAAPPEFATTFGVSLPHDVSFNIAPDGTFSMDGLPPGTYNFKTSTSCNPNYTLSPNIPAYTVTSNDVEVIRHCGSFDLFFNHVSNGTAQLFFGLQRYDEATDTWVHPETGVSEPAGEEIPFDENNAIVLTNNSTLYNIDFIGQFRIIKVFQSFRDGSEVVPDVVKNSKHCIEVLHEFEFNDDLQILEIINLTCSGDNADVEIIAQGVEPMTYKIVQKNGEPFTVDNGNNNIFTGLESAEYVVNVEDPCGEIEPQTFNVADLPSLVNAYQPDDLEQCDEGNDNVETFDLSVQDSDIIGTQDQTKISLSYHSSLTDAEQGLNALPANHSTGDATIYARVTHNEHADCIAITSFNVSVTPAPALNMEEKESICEGDSITLIADEGYASYEWSTGATTSSISVSEAGEYTVTATNEEGCETSHTVQVVVSSPPDIAQIEVQDWTDNDNELSILVEQNAGTIQEYEYSLDGIHYQGSNVFTGLAPGLYTVYVKDTNGCGLTNSQAYILTYPKFFTPNGDGINETWRIQFSMFEPGMLIYIYDRYGKLITGFGANSPGWDGTLNGMRLPSTDYWFVVKRENGREMRGHFSMIR